MKLANAGLRRYATTALFVLVLVIGMSALWPISSAEAGVITNWRSYGPTGIVGTNVPVLVDATGPNSPDPLVSSSLKLFIDGTLVPRSSYTSSVFARSVYVYYIPSPTLADGPHTFRVEVSDTAGRLSAKQWSATIAQPPSPSWVSPASGSVVYNGRPSIIMALSDNTPGTTYTITGQVRTGSASGPVVETFGMSTTSASAAFTLDSELAPGTYYLTASVKDSAGHTATLQGASARSFSCVSAAAMSIFNECDSCHAAERTAHPTPDNGNASCVKCHVGYDGQHMAPEPNCDSCHDEWHTNGAKTTVAITTSCTSCHSPSRPDLPRHTVENVGPQHVSGCGNCHRQSLITVHATTPAGSAYPNQCAMCHSSTSTRVKDAVAAGNVACSACHDADPEHGFNPAQHVATGTTCVAAGCHATTSLVDAHTPYVGEGNRYPQYEDTCSLCHYNTDNNRVPDDATAECSSCHPDRLEPHGYDPAKHISDETCLSGCHSTELKPVHDAAPSPVSCTGCHATSVAAVAPWDKSCDVCHEVIAHASADHAGTDAAVRVDRGGKGCSDTWPQNTNCHDISDLSALHSGAVDRGCPICHGEGATPARECRSCHPKNDPQTSEPFSATFYPTGDGPVVGTVQVSSDTALWDKVDEPNPGDGDGSWLQFTTSGSALFTTQRSIPDSATITSVIVYARAKSTSTTGRNYFPMVSVGGTTYQRSATNVVGSYTGGSGVAYQLNANPKTGAAWTPADLNSTGGANTLDYFGVGTSNVIGTTYLRVTQVNLVINYTLPIEVDPDALFSTTRYHHDNVKYLWDPADAPEGAYYVTQPQHGWNDALIDQDCFDFCHRTVVDPPVFTAYSGDRMWFSTAGAHKPDTRTLTLSDVLVPEQNPTLDFVTNWQLTGDDAGYVEISTDGGTSYTPLGGNVDGETRDSYTGDAPDWVPATYDLSAYAGQNVRIRFRLVIDDGALGWAFDDLAIKSAGEAVFSDDAETLSPKWDIYHWTRSNGAYPFH